MDKGKHINGKKKVTIGLELQVTLENKKADELANINTADYERGHPNADYIRSYIQKSTCVIGS